LKAADVPDDTIYALSSGSPPAGIAVVRVSGPGADAALEALAGRLPEPRRAVAAELHHPQTGELLDNALVLRFPGTGTATGEPVAELHVHGGRSVVAAVLGALGTLPGLRGAQPGEFTRRAFENGRMDLSEAEGLSDLLTAETESQRRAALALAGGALGRVVQDWQDRILAISAQIEAAIDFSDEADVDEQNLGHSPMLKKLVLELEATLGRPSVERLRDGLRVVIAGPPNAGKSSLLNWLAGRQAAITSAVAGTTRDIVEAPTAIGGSAFLLVDTAGLREAGDEVEAIGVERARASLDAADIVMWLGDPADCPDRARSIVIQPKADLDLRPLLPDADLRVSAETGEGMNELVTLLIARSRRLLPKEGEVATNKRHRDSLRECLASLREAQLANDLLIASECLRQARAALDRITGRAGVEHMLDTLFGRFCIGK
jgi:tRNA modification GTPase